jgi:hypothetical protein
VIHTDTIVTLPDATASFVKTGCATTDGVISNYTFRLMDFGFVLVVEITVGRENINNDQFRQHDKKPQ